MKPESRTFAIDPLLRWLFGIFLGSLVLIIGLRVFFGSLQAELNEQSANERARLFVGEEIVRGIQSVEKDLYKIAVTSNPAGVRPIRRTVDATLEKLHHDLEVLKKGGTVKRQILLNIEGRDEMITESTYRPADGEQPYIMEIIEIEPLVQTIPEKADHLAKLLRVHWDAEETGFGKEFLDSEIAIDTYLKQLPSFFRRLDENANRLFFDSSERLRVLEAQLAVQQERLRFLETILILLVIVFAAVGGVMVSKRISKNNLLREDALQDARLAREEAEKASRAKSEFVSRMSHELRTPLNAIIGFAQLLEDEQLQPSQKNYVGLINRSGAHLMELINAVLDHAKIEAGGLTLEKIRFDLPASIEAVRSIMLDKASSKGLHFSVSVAADLPRFIVGDPTRLRQILINLIGNSIKFTEKGSVELSVGREASFLVFSICDTGIGMDEAALSRLFKPFAQADETVTRRYGGTGLGLLISKELAEAMGGQVIVDSTVGVGSCFRIRIPLMADEEQRSQSLDKRTSELFSLDLAGMINGRVLLVDDNRVNQQLGSAMLRKLGLDFDLAGNGIECLAQLEKNSYALVFMDMEMPEMDGVTATREYRQREALKGGSRLPIIAMTANALAEDKQRCFDAGMDGYVSKPISFGSLLAEVHRLFEGAAPKAENGDASVADAPGSIYNRERVLDMLGDETLMDELSAMFVAESPKNIAELDQAWNSRDWKRLQRIAHTLKGLFATFAADALEARALRLEVAAGDEDAAQSGALLPSIKQDVARLADALVNTKKSA